MEVLIIIAIVIVGALLIYKMQISKNAIKESDSSKNHDSKYPNASVIVKGYGFLLRRYDAEKKVVINEDSYDYSDIIGCDINIQMKHTVVVEPTQSVSKSTTKTSLSSLAGRTVAGALIAGPIGAAIGGATAKKVTTTTTTTSSGFNRHVNRKLYDVIIHTKSKDIKHTTGNEVTANNIKKAIDKIKEI